MSRRILLSALLATALFLPSCTGEVDPDNACNDVDCSGRGFCVSRSGVPACECIDGYLPVEGPDCAPEDDGNPCLGVLCSGHGSCVERDGQAHCACDPDFEPNGLNCVRVDRCKGVTCSGHGTCRDDGFGGAVCDCEPGYHRVEPTTCEQDAVDACEDVGCSGHGSCVAQNGVASCQCDAGYHAEGLSCVEDPPDPCEGVGCSGHGTCEVQGDVAACACEPGYHAVGLTCVLDDPCEGVTCGAFAHCDAGDCFCDEGFEGDPYSACIEIDQTAAQIRAELVLIAEAELGMCEGIDERPYMEWQPGLWCYDFVMWVYAEHNEPLPQPIRLPQVDPDGQPAGWNPKPGDLIKYDIQHYGMVKEISADGTRIYTLEGNVNRCVMGRSTTHASVQYYGVLEDTLGDRFPGLNTPD